jgi:uncharacterized RDD family membrane protein YckC
MENLQNGENILIGTAQNVTIEYRLAGVGDRILAQFIDMLIIYGYWACIIFFEANHYSFIEDLPAFINLILLILPLTYHLFFEILNNGQSIGKMIAKIKVVQMDGSQPTISSYLLRWLFGLIEITSNVGAIALYTMLFNKNGQRLGDISAGTTVVKVKDVLSIDSTIFSTIDSNYEIRIPISERVSDEDISLINDVVKACEDPHRNLENHRYLSEKMKEYIEKKYDYYSDVQSVYFLDSILRDHNYLHGKVTHTTA